MPAKTSHTTKPDTTRCSHPLCNTQHTTTPQPHNHHHTHNSPTTNKQRGNTDALDGPGRERPPKNTTPTGCLLRTQQHAEHLWPYVPPSHTPTTQKTCTKKGM
jgi:hypothetical protein